ncbi:MAG: hypothetical protein ACLPY5_10550 [Candidatus Bathyarchaeia archaeon]
MPIQTESRSESTDSVLALSLRYIDETTRFLSRVQILILAALAGAAIVITTSTLEISGVVVLSEPVEFATASASLFLIIPAAAYYTICSARAMARWKANLADFSFALRFESQKPKGDSPRLKLANQAIQALETYTRPAGILAHPAEFTDYQLGDETYDVVIPNPVTKALGGISGALVMKRFTSGDVSVEDVSRVIRKVRVAGVRIWRLMVVSDREFPVATLEFHKSRVRELSGFPVDLVEESPSGFSVVSLGD